MRDGRVERAPTVRRARNHLFVNSSLSFGIPLSLSLSSRPIALVVVEPAPFGLLCCPLPSDLLPLLSASFGPVKEPELPPHSQERVTVPFDSSPATLASSPYEQDTLTVSLGSPFRRPIRFPSHRAVPR